MYIIIKKKKLDLISIKKKSYRYIIVLSTFKECLQKNKSSYFVSWRELQSWRPPPMSQKPRKRAFFFRWKKKKTQFFTYRDNLIFAPPHPPVCRRQNMSFFYFVSIPNSEKMKKCLQIIGKSRIL